MDGTKECSEVLSTEGAKWDQLLHYCSATPDGQANQREKSFMSYPGGFLYGNEKQRNFYESRHHHSPGITVDKRTNWFPKDLKQWFKPYLHAALEIKWQNLRTKVGFRSHLYNLISIIWSLVEYSYHMITQPFYSINRDGELTIF